MTFPKTHSTHQNGVRLERQAREQSDFLQYKDAAGRFLDFHSLRHTTGSLLAAAGVHPKVAQTVMRHSTIDLTMSRYTHVFKGQESDAVANLPDLGQKIAQPTKEEGTNNPAPIPVSGAKTDRSAEVIPVCDPIPVFFDSAPSLAPSQRQNENLVDFGGLKKVDGPEEASDGSAREEGTSETVGVGFEPTVDLRPRRFSRPADVLRMADRVVRSSSIASAGRNRHANGWACLIQRSRLHWECWQRDNGPGSAVMSDPVPSDGSASRPGM